MPYVNADEIAKQVGSDYRNRDIAAGRKFVRKWEEYESKQEDFAIETTLASRSLAPKIRRLREHGYQFHLIYFWLPSAELAIERVAERVRQGGHDIPTETITRRYRSGLRNFLNLYMTLADTWAVFRNLQLGAPEAIARGRHELVEGIQHPQIWDQINAGAD